MINKKSITILAFALILFTFIPSVSAHCPLCTVATGAAVAVTRSYGVDDSIVGLFIGAFIISTALWFDNLLKRKNKGKNYLPAQSLILVIVFLALTILTFYFAKLLGQNKIFGIDKLVFGTLLGSVITPAGFSLSKLLKKKNKGKAFFPFQSIILPLILLVIVAIIFYFSILK